MEEPSPQLEAYFELCKRIYERLDREGKWAEALAAIRADRAELEAKEFDSPNG
jgi:hypothetical protein